MTDEHLDAIEEWLKESPHINGKIIGDLFVEVRRLRADNAALTQVLAEVLSEIESSRPEPIGYVEVYREIDGRTSVNPSVTSSPKMRTVPLSRGARQVCALVPVRATP
jgi:hypothetical protein